MLIQPPTTPSIQALAYHGKWSRGIGRKGQAKRMNRVTSHPCTRGELEKVWKHRNMKGKSATTQKWDKIAIVLTEGFIRINQGNLLNIKQYGVSPKTHPLSRNLHPHATTPGTVNSRVVIEAQLRQTSTTVQLFGDNATNIFRSRPAHGPEDITVMRHVCTEHWPLGTDAINDAHKQNIGIFCNEEYRGTDKYSRGSEFWSASACWEFINVAPNALLRNFLRTRLAWARVSGWTTFARWRPVALTCSRTDSTETRPEKKSSEQCGAQIADLLD